MIEKTIFEIPIYPMSRKEFDSRWGKKRKSYYDELVRHGHSEERARQGVSLCFYPKWLWEYNQIIGFIKIAVTKTDVIFSLYCSMDKRFHIDSKTKHFIEDWSINGTHFYAISKSEADIKHEIRTWLQFIEKQHLKQRFYVDYSTFNNVFDYVNIKEIMETI